MPAISDFIRTGLKAVEFQAQAVAKFAQYTASQANRTTPQPTRAGSNADSISSQRERILMGIDGEHIIKNTSFGAAYAGRRINYCSTGMTYHPDTGDTKLDEAISAYCIQKWEHMGDDCSMEESFSRVADVEQPGRGDAALGWYRDESSLRLMEIQGDRIGELHTIIKPGIDSLGRRYFAGVFLVGGSPVGYRVYEKGHNDYYANPKFYDAQDIIFFKDNKFKGVRGMTIFHAALESVMKRYKILDITMDTMAQQSKIAAISRNNSGEPDEDSYDELRGTSGLIDYVETYASGSILKYQFIGDDYEVMKAEHPSEAFIKACDHLDKHGCYSVNMPYEFLMTPEGIGGAPSRFAFSVAGKEIMRIRRRHTSKLNVIKDVTILEAVEKKVFKASPFILRGNWNWPTLPTADAFYDVQADVMAIRAGTTSRGRVISSNIGASVNDIRRETVSIAIADEKAIQDANKQLEQEGYEPNLTKADIVQATDNPGAMQPQGKEDGEQGDGRGKPPFGKKDDAEKDEDGDDEEKPKGRFSAYLGDVPLRALPYDTAIEIERVSGISLANHSSAMVVHCRMTVPDLLTKADQHNLETARGHMMKVTCRECANRVCYAPIGFKYILLINDRIVDGHHWLAAAERGKVTKSLDVLDLTPLRFQRVMMDQHRALEEKVDTVLAKLSAWDESKVKRDDDGKFATSSGLSEQPKVAALADSARAKLEGIGITVPDVNARFDLEHFKKEHGDGWMNIAATIEHNAEGGATLIVNPAYDRIKGMAQVVASAPEGQFSSNAPDHILTHELAHAAHGNSIGYDRAFELATKKMVAYEKRVAEKVSKRAAVNPMEFVAETIAGIAAGKEYDSDVMDQLKAWGGSSVMKAAFSAWDESKVKRDDEGQFAPIDRSKYRSLDAREGPMRDLDTADKKLDPASLPAHIKPQMIPPAYRNDVQISDDPNADVWVKMRDQSGRAKTVYNPEYEKQNKQRKWSRVSLAIDEANVIREQIQSARTGENREEAEAAWLMSVQATRPGSEADKRGVKKLWQNEISSENVIEQKPKDKKDKSAYSIKIGNKTIPIRDAGTKAQLKARLDSGQPLGDAGYWIKSHGVTTLEGRHVISGEDGIRLQFVGKEGVWHDHLIKDEGLAAMLSERKANAGDRGKLFNTKYDKVADYVSSLGAGVYSPKDLRTIRANEIATKLIGPNPVEVESEQAIKEMVKSIGEQVANVLGNRWQQAVESYINPQVFTSIKVKK